MSSYAKLIKWRSRYATISVRSSGGISYIIFQTQIRKDTLNNKQSDQLATEIPEMNMQ
jgi:hypothetical protein